MDQSLKDKVAIITGAGSGMGEAIARLFAERGAKVVIADMNEKTLNKVCPEIKDAGQAVWGVVTDVSKEKDLDDLFKETIDKFGTVDILVNNAGILDDYMTVGDLDLKLWEKVMDVNVKGPTYLCSLVINYWLKEKKGGVIINTASVGGLFGARGGVGYVTSKHALIGLTKNIASVYMNDKIRAVAIAPGAVETNIGNTLKNPDKKGLHALNEFVAAGPTGKAVDVAEVVAFLASDAAKFVNGTVVTVDGGWTGA